MNADALPREPYTTIAVRWNEERSFCEEWEGSHLTLIGEKWYLTEGISHVSAQQLAGVIDSFQIAATSPLALLREILAAGGYVSDHGATPWIITPEDLQGVAARYGCNLESGT